MGPSKWLEGSAREKEGPRSANQEGGGSRFEKNVEKNKREEIRTKF